MLIMADIADMCMMESKITSKAVKNKKERENTRKEKKEGKEESCSHQLLYIYIYTIHTFPNREGHSNNSISSWNTIQTTYEI